jgi:hypothetical protein
MAGAAAVGVVSLLVTDSKFAAANPGAVSQQTYAYGLVDPNANGGGTPGFVFHENMASVRRVGVGRYCLRASVHFDTGPVITTTADGKLTNGRYGLAISDLGNRACNKRLQELESIRSSSSTAVRGPRTRSAL